MRRYETLELLPQTAPFGGELMREHGLRGLQCGSGPQLRQGWLNTDMLHLRTRDDKEVQRGRIAVLDNSHYFLEHDATEPFPFADEAFDWVYSEHFVEHLHPGDTIAWLEDVRRILRPGGRVRISTPDLRKYVRGYLEDDGAFLRRHHELMAPHLQQFMIDPDDETQPQQRRNIKRQYFTGEDAIPSRRAFMVNQIFFFWGHHWIYDFDELRYVLSMAGFDPERVSEHGFREGHEPEMATLDRENRSDESVYVEAER
jgi:SAM-dependent methyltransferase